MSERACDRLLREAHRTLMQARATERAAWTAYESARGEGARGLGTKHSRARDALDSAATAFAEAAHAYCVDVLGCHEEPS